MSDAKSQAQSMGRAQRQAGQRPHDKDRSQVTDRESGSGGNVDKRASRSDRSESFGFGFVLGGILSQLVSDAEDRLAEMRECVNWYQREVEKCEERLTQLHALTAQLSDEQE